MSGFIVSASSVLESYSSAVVCWILFTSCYFTLKLKFANFRLLPHAFVTLKGKESGVDGDISPFQALMVALSGTVGLGNIAGTAFGVFIGGPGVVFWMIVAGMLGMCLKFAEITMAHKYRFINKTGHVVGGSFEYIRLSLHKLGFRRLGSFMAGFYALLLLFAVLTGGNMFQANQLVKLVSDHYLSADGTLYSTMRFLLPLALASFIAITTLKDVGFMGKILSKTLPVASSVFICISLLVISMNHANFVPAIKLIMSDAFTGKAMGVGVLGVVFIGVQRAFYASTAGLGISTVIHASAQTDEPAREGCVGMLEPLLDTVFICMVCGLVIVTSGATGHFTADTVARYGGVVIADYAYSASLPIVGVMLHICIACFAISVITSLRYVAAVAWEYLFGYTMRALFRVIYCVCTYVGSLVNFGIIMDIADCMTLSLAIPNAVALILLGNEVAKDKEEYVEGVRQHAVL